MDGKQDGRLGRRNCGPRAQEGAVGRRNFLEAGLALAAGGISLDLAPAFAAPAGAGYAVSGFSGDEPEPAHKIVRDALAAKSPAPSEKHEVVIVGAGLAGMTAAVKLRRLDTLVLETAKEIGGTARAGRLGPHEFNIGAAYFTGVEGEIGKLWDEVGLKLTPVDQPNDRWLLGGKWIEKPWHDEGILSTPPAVQRAMLGMKKAMVALEKGPDFPQNPYHLSTPRALALDKITFAEWIKPWAHPDLYAFVDAYSYSALGASAKTVSAYGALNFYVEFMGSIYAFPEGNYRLVRELAATFDKAGAGRVRKGCTVYRIVPEADGRARVCYVQNGEARAVLAKRVVLAAPFLVASRLITGLSAAQRYALNAGGYAAYFVLNMIFDRVVNHHAFDSWVPAAHVFDDFIATTWPDSKRHAQLLAQNAGQVISLFAPCRRPVLGRWRMLTQRPDAVARPIVEAWLRLNPQARPHLKHVHVTRWGHAIIINRPGMVTKWLPKLKKQIGPIHLAHSDGQGLPAVESSTQEAMEAARKILAGWKR
jgi:protoporphyrinogen oxidase